MHRWSILALAIFCAASGAAAQGQKKGYLVTDPNGKGVYLIPDVIAEKTVNVTMSQPAAPAPVLKRGASYLVQVGAFAVPANAARLAKQLEQDNYRVLRSKARFERRNLTVDVVSVGGIATLEEANKVLGIMRASYGLQGLIVPPGVSTLAAE